MKNFLSIILICLYGSLQGYSQVDPDALKVLDRFSAEAQKAPSVTMKFRLITNNQPENKIDSSAGSVIISRDKYKLDLPNNIIWFDGINSFSYLPAEKEVTITRPDKKDNSFQSKPSRIFTMYKKDFKCRLIEENLKAFVIDLYPVDIKSDLIRIRLTIGKSTYNLVSMEYKRKDGIIATINVLDYNLKQVPAPDIFNFKPEKYKDAEVVDMR